MSNPSAPPPPPSPDDHNTREQGPQPQIVCSVCFDTGGLW